MCYIFFRKYLAQTLKDYNIKSCNDKVFALISPKVCQKSWTNPRVQIYKEKSLIFEVIIFLLSKFPFITCVSSKKHSFQPHCAETNVCILAKLWKALCFANSLTCQLPLGLGEMLLMFGENGKVQT